MNKTAEIRVQTIPSAEGIRIRKVKKRSFWQIVRSHIRRLTIEIVNFFLNHDLVFRLAGIINKRVKIIDFVFLAYPANDDYTYDHVYPFRLLRVCWQPWPVGVFYQNGKFGIMFAISSTDRNFRDSRNEHNLRYLVERMEELRKIFNAKRKTFAGTLPGILFAKRMLRETYEADVAVKVVNKAMEEVRVLENLPEDTPIIVLGGRGFIGRRVVKFLPKNNVYSVDIAYGKGRQDWPFHLQGKRVLLINIALNSALDEYLDLLWSEIVIINEVYPEPSLETVEELKKIGCRCYHIAGVKAKSIPSFPRAYQGGIPCCAAWLSEDMEVLLLEIV